MIRWITPYALAGALTVAAQQPSTPPSQAAAVLQVPGYDLVTSIKPSRSNESGLRIRMDQEAIFIQNATLQDLLANTYGIRSTLIFNLPRWAQSDRFDIRAKVLSDDTAFLQHINRAQRRQIFERLLAENFGAVTHRETRTLPVYELVRVGPGPLLVENPPPPPSAGPEPIKPGRNGRGNTSVIGTHLDATGVRIRDLCSNLAIVLDRSVMDRTGLTSMYDITLNWTDETTLQAAATEQSAPPLFTALQEQLGLKLVPSKGPVEVLVVDKAAPPKEVE